jgi:hypothetical protein
VLDQLYKEIHQSHQKPIQAYSKEMKKLVNISLSVVASLRDQPERRDLLHLSGGNSKYHCRFGYSIDIQYVSDNLKACKHCYDSLLEELYPTDPLNTANDQGLWRSGLCTECVCWRFNTDSNLLSFPPPENYPAKHIKPKKFAFRH